MRFFFNPLSGQVNAGPPREIVYSDTAPLYPLEGGRWFDTINLREYVYTGKEWVESGVGPAGVKGDTGVEGPLGPVGPVGATGPQGPAATVAVGAVTTGAAGGSATVSNAGTSGAAVLNFTIPQGAKGETGAIGPVGPVGPQGIKGDVGNTGAQGIQGVQGSVGPTGPTGATGTAATVTVGTTSTGAAGTNASVSNSGTASAAVLNFSVPRGATGAVGPQGPTGADGTSVKLKGSVAQVANLPTTGNTAGDLWVVTATGDGYVWSGSAWSNAGPIRGPVGPAGAVGATGATGTAATVTVGTTSTGAAGTNASVSNSGTASAAVLNFSVPRGATGATGSTGAVGPQGPQGPQGVKGDTGNTGAQGPAGPAPTGTGAVVVSNGVLGTPVGYGTANTVNTLVQRDASGNFSAGTITANLTGNASGSAASCTGNAATATKLATTRAINVSGDVTGTAQNFDGSAAITIPTAIALGVIVNADINDAAAIADTKLATISTAGKVSNSATTATSANTNSAIVARDASGNFSAGIITAALSGNATTASSAAKLTTARTINGVSFDGSSNITIGAAPTAHNHDAADITVGTLANARLPARLQAASQTITDWNNAVENGWFQGSQAANAPEGVLDWWLGYVEAHYDRWVTQTVHRFTADAPTNTHIWRRSSYESAGVRLWGAWYKLQLSQGEQDARYSLGAHTHGNITNAGAIGVAASLPIITGTNGVLQAGAFGTAAGSFCQGNDARLSDARIPTSHAHDASDITVGTLASARLPARLQATAQGITDWDLALENGWYEGNKAANAPEGVLDWWLGYVEAHANQRWVTQTVHRFTADAPTNTHIWRRSSSDNGTARVWGAWYKLQLSQGEQDARYALTAHTHGNITNAGAIGVAASLPIVTGTNGVLQAGAFGTTAGSFCQGNDARLSDARTPTSHTHSDATTTVAGFMAAADKTKLDAVTFKRLVVVATTVNIIAVYDNGASGVGATLTSPFLNPSGIFAVDGLNVSLNSRVLVKDQTSAFQNGVYDIIDRGSATTPWVLRRAADLDSGLEFTMAAVMVNQGAANSGKLFIVQGAAINIGSSAINWREAGYVHPTTDGNLHVPATSTTNNGKVLKAGATAGSLSWGTLTAADVGAAVTSHTHSNASTTVAGFLSAADKTKLDGFTTPFSIPYTFSQIAKQLNVNSVSINATGNLILIGKSSSAGIYYVNELGISLLQSVHRDLNAGVTNKQIVDCKINAEGDVVVLAYSWGDFVPSGTNAIEVYELNRADFSTVSFKSVFYKEWADNATIFSLGVNSLGNRIVVGVPRATGTKNNVGKVVSFVKIQNTWEEKSTYVGDAWSGTSTIGYTYFGWAVDFADSTSSFISGAPLLDSNAAQTSDGRVKVYSGTVEPFTQAGQNINGEFGSGEEFGTSVSINSDGTVIAVGAPKYKVSGITRGRVKLFFWDGTSWVNRGIIVGGPSALGSTGEQFGVKVQLNHAGDMLLVSAPLSPFTKYVKIYKWKGGTTWEDQAIALQGDEGIKVLLTSQSAEFGRDVAANASFNTIIVGYSGGCNVYRSAVKKTLM